MIEIRNAGKIYGRRPGVVALRDVSLTIASGQVTAVIGPNGAGKSTLFGLILGFLRPSSGDVSILDLHPQDYLHRHGVGYVSERFALPPGWPVRRALAALGAMAGLAGSRIDDTLQSFGLHEHQDKTIGSLSRGLLQRFGLAQAFAAERDLLVLDEPAEGLDPLWRIQLRDRITQQRDAGRTVLLASHDLAEVERVADTVIILDKGAVRDVGHNSTRASGAATYRIELAEPFDHATDIFPNATSAGSTTLIIAANGTEDLNSRISALIESGGRITAVSPTTERLEARVQRTIES